MPEPLIIFSLVVVSLTSLTAQSQENLPPLTRGVTHENWTADIPGLTPAKSSCAVADDPSYGLTADNPIKVGGDAMYLAARSKQYMRSVGQPVKAYITNGYVIWRSRWAAPLGSPRRTTPLRVTLLSAVGLRSQGQSGSPGKRMVSPTFLGVCSAARSGRRL